MQWEYEKVSGKINSSNKKAILEEYLKMTEEALEKRKGEPIDIVAWPETAFRGVLEDEKTDSMVKRVINFVKKEKIVLITGGYYRNKEKIFTGFLVFEPSGEVKKYLKTYLVPFGEYIPFEAYLKRFHIRQKLPRIGNFTAGKKPHILELHLSSGQTLLIGPQVCYEGLVSRFSRKLSYQGAQVFFNLTNDSWYGLSSEPYQHFLITVAKSVEYRRPLVRVTNTGLTGFISPSGKIFYDKDLYKMKAIDLKVPYSLKVRSTFYEKFFFLPPLFFLFASFFIILKARRK